MRNEQSRKRCVDVGTLAYEGQQSQRAATNRTGFAKKRVALRVAVAVLVRYRRRKCDDLLMKLEAPPGFEPGVEVLQTSALPLGDGADRT